MGIYFLLYLIFTDRYVLILNKMLGGYTLVRISIVIILKAMLFSICRFNFQLLSNISSAFDETSQSPFAHIFICY